MAQSPLELMRELHSKHIYASGRENVVEIARGLGFSSISTADDINAHFPTLDCIDKARRARNDTCLAVDSAARRSASSSSRPPFRPIDAIVLFTEPLRWETQLQLMLDLLVSGGDPRTIVGAGSSCGCGCGAGSVPVGPRTHPALMAQTIPVIACNADLLWMAEPLLPRLGHGSYLRCLETLFEVRCSALSITP